VEQWGRSGAPHGDKGWGSDDCGGKQPVVAQTRRAAPFGAEQGWEREANWCASATVRAAVK
jgi:hypothetical protein